MKFRLLAAPEIDDDIRSKYDRIYQSEVDDLKIVVKDNLWGGIDEQGKETIPLIYNELSNFENKYGICRTSLGYGLINTENKVILPIEYKDLFYIDGFYIAIKNESFRIFSPSLKLDKDFQKSNFFQGENQSIYTINLIEIRGSKIFEIISTEKNSIYLLYANNNFILLELNKEKFDKILDEIVKIHPTFKTAYYSPGEFKLSESRELKKFIQVKSVTSSPRYYHDVFCFLENNELVPVFFTLASELKRIGTEVYIFPRITIGADNGDSYYYGLLTLDGKTVLPQKYYNIKDKNLGSKVEVTEINVNGRKVEKMIDLETGKYLEETERLEIAHKIKIQLTQDRALNILDLKGNIVLECKHLGYYSTRGTIPTNFIASKKGDNNLVIGDSYGRILKELPYSYIFNIGNMRQKEYTKWSDPTSISLRGGEYGGGKFEYAPLMFPQDTLINREVYHFEGLSYVRDNQGKCGVVDVNFKIVIPVEYDKLQYALDENHMNYFVATRWGKQGVITIDNVLILPFIYDKITMKFLKTYIFSLRSQGQDYRVSSKNIDLFSKRTLETINSISPAEVLDEFSIATKEDNPQEKENKRNKWVQYHQDEYLKHLNNEKTKKETKKEERKLLRMQRALEPKAPAQEPPAQEPPAQEPPAQEPPAQEPPAQEPPIQEPPIQEPPIQEPPIQEGFDPGEVDRNQRRRWRATIQNTVRFQDREIPPGTRTTEVIYAVDDRDALQQLMDVCPGSSPEDFLVEEIP